MGSVTETSGAAMLSSCTEEENVGQLGFIFSKQSFSPFMVTKCPHKKKKMAKK
jgi:hypothetical protein